MIGREKRVLLRHYLEQGMSKAAIARRLEIGRRTVYNWIEAGELDRAADDRAVGCGPRSPGLSRLDSWGRRHALMVVLGYSRWMWLRFYERHTMMAVIRGLEAASPTSAACRSSCSSTR